MLFLTNFYSVYNLPSFYIRACPVSNVPKGAHVPLAFGFRRHILRLISSNEPQEGAPHKHGLAVSRNVTWANNLYAVYGSPRADRYLSSRFRLKANSDAADALIKVGINTRRTEHHSKRKNSE
jgi:hypothetical protein